MPIYRPAFALALMPLALSGCAYFNPYQDNRPLPPANPPTFCYETIGRPACYDRPQIGLGDLINEQVPPVVVLQPTPIVAAPTAVLTPEQIEALPNNAAIAVPVATKVVTTTEEPPLVIRTPDPYPEPTDRALTVPAEPFTDAPVQLKAPAR